MTTGNQTPKEKKFRPFQIRWKEALGNKDCPYAYRWTFNFWFFAIRVHQWLKTEDRRYMHDHPWNFITLVLKGGYVDVTETGRDALKIFSVRYRPATHKHYVEVNEGGCVTILLTGPVIRNWGYWVGDKFKRPLRYFGKYGHPPCHD